MRRNCLFLIFLLFVVGSACNRSPRDYVERGRKFFSDEKYEDASIQYRKAIQKDSNFGEAYYQLGLSEIKRQNLGDAYEALSRAVGLMPNSDEAKVKLADVCLTIYLSDARNRVQHDRVLDISSQLLAKNPNSFDGLRLSGLVALADRKTKDALGYLQKANEVQPMNPDVITSLTQALIAENQFAAGEKLALELIQKDKTFGPIYDVLYSQYIGAKRTADAEQILRTKAANNPTKARYLLDLAEFYARSNRWADTLSTLQRVLENPKDFPNAHRMVGEFYVRNQKWDEAIREFEQGAKAVPKEKADYQKRIVSVLRAQGKPEEALQAVTEILTADPKDQDSRAVRATLWVESRKPEHLAAALPELQALIQERPGDADLRFTLGRAYMFQNNPDAARTQFQEAIRRRNDHMPARVALVVLYLNQRKAHDALTAANELVTYDGSSALYRLLYAAALTDTGDYNEARVQLTLILKQAPGNRDARLQLGLVAIAQKKFKEAEEIFSKLHEGGKEDVRAATGLVNVYSSENQFEKAIQLLNEDLKKSPNSAATRSLLASTAAHAGKYDLAIAEYLKLVSQVPNSAEPRIRLAQTYLSKGDTESAAKMLEQVVQLEPKNAGALEGLAGILLQTGRLQEAKKRYQQLVELQPENPRALNDMAFVLSETGGNLDEALSMVQRAMTRMPDSDTIKDTLGWIYFKKNQTDSAVQVFNALVKKDAENPDYHYHLGAALLQKGDKPRAKTELQAALEKKPSSGDAANIRQLLARAQ